MAKTFTSNLVSRTVPDVTGAYNSRNERVSRISLHHCAGWFETSLRFLTQQSKASSAHFMIGDEDIVLMNGPTERACWSDANPTSNQKTVSIEMSNSSLAPQWLISEKTIISTARLCAELSKFYNLGTLVLGKNVFLHKDVSQLGTSCPGPYGSSQSPRIVEMANKILRGENTSVPINNNQEIPFQIRITAEVLNVRSEPNTNSSITTTVTENHIFTIVEKSGDWGRLASGAGWMHLGYTQSYSPVSWTQRVQITAEVLNVRSEPNTNSPITTTVTKGNIFTIVNKSGDWGRLVSGAGWVHLGYTKNV